MLNLKIFHTSTIICLSILFFSVFTATMQAEPFDGYTLFNPNNSATTYLIDMDGMTVHSWQNSLGGGYAVYLLESGNLLRPSKPIFTYLNGAASSGLIQETNWDGEVVWQFEYNTPDYLMHHDIEPLPNGNALLIAWEVKSEAEVIAAGRNTTTVMWPDHIIEVEPAGHSATIVWEWHAWDHLVQDHDPTKENYGVIADHPELFDINMPISSGGPWGGGDWLHVNGIDYIEQYDQIVFSSHFTDEFYIIDHSTTTEEAAGHTGGNSGMGGDLLYRWGCPGRYNTTGNNYFEVLHCPIWLTDDLPGAGDILVFHNSTGNHISEVVQITPPVDESGNYYLEPGQAFEPRDPSWVYSNGTGFYSNNRGGCQRLPNGNTLIIEPDSGYMFEVDSLGNTEWEYDSIYSIARILRYAPEYPGLAELFPNSVGENSAKIPGFNLSVYPNPFNSSTIVRYEIGVSGKVSANIYNVLGQQVKSLVNKYHTAGNFEVSWDGTDDSGIPANSGVYFFNIGAADRAESRKLIMVK